eukprot:COSAG01_NODE_4477_length_4987_cov_42.965630_2_plen_238_part_00
MLASVQLGGLGYLVGLVAVATRGYYDDVAAVARCGEQRARQFASYCASAAATCSTSCRPVVTSAAVTHCHSSAFRSRGTMAAAVVGTTWELVAATKRQVHARPPPPPHYPRTRPPAPFLACLPRCTNFHSGPKPDACIRAASRRAIGVAVPVHMVGAAMWCMHVWSSSPYYRDHHHAHHHDHSGGPAGGRGGMGAARGRAEDAARGGAGAGALVNLRVITITIGAVDWLRSAYDPRG